MTFVEIYIDGITIYSKTFDEHIDHIKEVRTKVREHIYIYIYMGPVSS